MPPTTHPDFNRFKQIFARELGDCATRPVLAKIEAANGIRLTLRAADRAELTLHVRRLTHDALALHHSGEAALVLEAGEITGDTHQAWVAACCHALDACIGQGSWPAFFAAVCPETPR